MKFFHVTNLTEQVLKNDVLPWDFVLVGGIPEAARSDKIARQAWYRNAATRHHFYTSLEPSNSNIRPSKENPARLLHGIVADYDLVIPDARIDEAVEAMKIKPAWIERSLGGNSRLVWLFSKPLMVDDNQFAIAVLTASEKWLSLAMLPGLDSPALRDPTRLFCNGCNWRATDAGPVSETALQAFFVEVALHNRFRGENNNTNIPLDVVEKELAAKYPGFSWPGPFALESQGPSFWIAGASAPLSAIVKSEGMFSFSAHAEKPFYPWSDILGADFVKQFSEAVITKATHEVYYDGKVFWRRKNGYFASANMAEILNFMKVECRLSAKPDKSGQSATDLALNHIYNAGHVVGAAPFLHRPSGVLEFLGKKTLNTFVSKITAPAAVDGETPFLDMHFDNLFDPPEQKSYFFAWIKHYYINALAMTPMPGQNVYLMGGANVGKTMTSRAIVGLGIFGGFADAAEFLVHGASFNSELFEAPIWCVDDETPGESATKQSVFFALLKKITANQQFRHNKKFEVATMIEWMGRILCTTNLDYVSSRMLGPMDNTSMDKTNLFRCSSSPKITFPTRHELTKIIQSELPFFLRRLLVWEPPDFVVPDVRFGYRAYHEPALLDQSHQSSRVAPFKELLIESLAEYFTSNLEATEWRGTVTQIIRFLILNPLNEHVMRSLRLEQINRYLEQIQREDLFRCTVVKGELNTRVWVFKRFGKTKAVPDAPAIPASPVVNIFSK